MKKFGFTLSEVMVALSIVGVMAAVVGPAISNLAPDKNKSIYLDYFNKINSTTQKLLADSSIYYKGFEPSEDESYYAAKKCIDLGCMQRAQNPSFNQQEGSRKYPYLIARSWGVTDLSFTRDRSFFDTPDGITWIFQQNEREIVVPKDANDANFYVEGQFIQDGTGNFETVSYRIVMQLPDGGRPCTYSADCRKPRYYTYNVDTYGNVTPADALSRAYMQNQHKMNDKQKDYDCAARIIEGQPCTD